MENAHEGTISTSQNKLVFLSDTSSNELDTFTITCQTTLWKCDGSDESQAQDHQKL